MSLALQFSGEGAQILQNYAARNQVDLSEFVLRAALEKIEDEHDLQLYKKAMAEYKADPVTYSLSEVKERLGL